MIYKFSEVAPTKAEFEKWVNDKKAEVEKTIYSNRRDIYRNEVNKQLDDFDSLKKAWDGMTRLREKSSDYDIDIKIDNQGYTEFKVRFPITKEQYEKILDDRNTYCKENDIPRSCAYMCEWLWKGLKDQIKTDFDFVRFHEGDYVVEDTCDTYVKKVSVGRFK
jgi:hypothetical protein